MEPPAESSAVIPSDHSSCERSPDQRSDRPAAGGGVAPAIATGDASSDPTSDDASDQSSDSLANSNSAGGADSEPYSTRRERVSPAAPGPPAPTHQALNSRVRLPTSVRLSAAPGSSHDSSHESAAASDSDSKGTASGDSLTYVTPDEYIRHIYPRPARTHRSHGAHSRDMSYSSESPELYFQGRRNYDRRSYGGLCLSMSIVAIIVAVIGIVSVAAYLGVVTTEEGKALQYEMQYSGQFRVLRGDFYHPSLGDTKSNNFKHKAARYQKMLETLYGASYISEAFRHADVRALGGDALTVFFRIHLDRRKIPKSVLNTEEALRDVLIQEVMALEPRAFRALEVDINSIQITREKSGHGALPARVAGGATAGGRTPAERWSEDDGAQSAAATTQVQSGKATVNAAVATRGGVRVGTGAEREKDAPPVHQLEDWIGPQRASSELLSGREQGEGTTAASPRWPAQLDRPITEYQPSAYGDFPPALVGDELDIASAATVASHHWLTKGGARLPGRPDLGPRNPGPTRHQQELGSVPGSEQTSRREHVGGLTSVSSQTQHHESQPHETSDSSNPAGVVTTTDGAARNQLPAAVGTGSEGGTPHPPGTRPGRPSPPQLVPFIDRPSLELPQYDLSPWRPVLPTSRRPQTPQQPGPPPSAPGPGNVQPRPTFSGPGVGSIRPGPTPFQSGEIHRGPGPLEPESETVQPTVPTSSGSQTENVQPQPIASGSKHENVLPVAFWPRPVPLGFQIPPQQSRPSSQAAQVESSTQPGPHQFGSGLLQMLSDFVLSGTKPEVLSRTEPDVQSESEQSQDQPQSHSQSEPHDQSSNSTSQVEKSGSDELPPVTVVYKPAPDYESKEAPYPDENSTTTSPDEEEEMTTEGNPETTTVLPTTTVQASRAPSNASSTPPILIITYSAVNSSSSPIKTFSAQEPIHLPDTLVRKTLTILSQNETEDSRLVTHPSGIISRSPLASHDLDPVTSEHHKPNLPPTTPSPSQAPHRSEISTSGIQFGLTEDGELVTTSSPVPLRTVPPHLHYRVVTELAPDQDLGLPPTPPPPVPPSPPGITQQATAVSEDPPVTFTVAPEESWEQDGRVTRPFFQPVTSYSGVYPPSRPKPPSQPHPDYAPAHDEYDLTATAAGDDDGDYLYYDTEFFTEKNSVKSIFDMFSTRKPLVLDTDVVTSTSVREAATPERQLLTALLRRASRRRQAAGRAPKRDGTAAGTLADEEVGVGRRDDKTDGKDLSVSDGQDSSEPNVSRPHRRKRRSLSWLSFPRTSQYALPEPAEAPRSHQHAVPTLPHPTQAPNSTPRAPAHHTSSADPPTSSSHAARARRVRRPSYSSQSVASLAARLRLAATPTTRPRRGSRVRLAPRREKLADKLMRFRGVRSRGIFATTARPARRWRTEGPTRLPNSAPIHVIKYSEGVSVDDILDTIFGSRREFENSRGTAENEVGSTGGDVKVEEGVQWTDATEPTTSTTASALWRASDASEAWSTSEKSESWSPVKVNVPWSMSEDAAAAEQIDPLDHVEQPSSDAPLSENRLQPTAETANSAAESTEQTTTARPTSPTDRLSSSRPPQQWRPVRFRLPTLADWPKVADPPRLADKLSQLTTTPGPALMSARPALTAADAQVVADTDNEVGTAGRPAAAVPTRPTLASLLSNYTYLEDSLTPPAAVCPADKFRCVSGECVPRLSRCDMLRDCADGTDELGCTCADRLHAQFLERKICDGVIDCHDNTDEQFCDWCRPGQFICPGAKRCVDASAICDGQYDCPDGSDEQRCVTLAATRGAAGQRRYQPAGYLMVRKRGRWGPLCVDNFEALVSQTRTAWSVQELGRAVCSALTYNGTRHVFSTEASHDTEHQQKQQEQQQEAFYQLVLSPDAPRNNSDDTSLVFEEAICPRQTSVHVSCDGLKCGLRPRVKQRQARIVGGTNSSPGAWPWQAAMYRDGEYQCGATLISDQWLLSAGHCFLRSTSNHWVARLGAYRRGSTLLSPFESLHVVSHIIVHPDYEDVGYVNDIALLKLADTVSMSDFVRPVCLPPPRSEVTEGAICSVVGWGQLFESGRIFPDTLQEVELPLIPAQQCRKRTARLPLYTITDDMFCAGYDRGGRDACLGDSGGPLMCQEPSGEWTLTGITSNGYGCARALRPGVYTKVANYVSWIDDVTTGPLPRGRRTHCRGHRCPLGRCLKDDKVCDGVVDCADGSDEHECPAAL